MIVTPDYCSFYKLFDASNCFVIPKYQRGYAWTEEEILDFCNDVKKMVQGKKEHFFGAIVCSENTDNPKVIQYELIDGQQRLSTLNIFMARLIHHYQTLEAKKANDQKYIADKVAELTKLYLTVEYHQNMRPVIRPRISLSRADEQFFRGIITGKDVAETRESHKRIRVAVDMIDELIQSLVTKKRLPAIVAELEKIEEAVTTRGFLIHVVASSVTDAYKLFQVLNNRGLSLSAGDLLRALTLEQLQTGSKALSEKAEEVWDSLLDDKSAKIEERLRWYYSAHNGSYPGKSTLYEDFKSKFGFDDADTVSKRKKLVERLDDMSQAFDFFSKIEEGCWPLSKPNPLPQWYECRLNNLVKVLRHTHCMPLLYAVSLNGTQQNLLTVIRLLERFFFRYKVMSRGHATPMSDVYLSHAYAAISQKVKVDLNGLKKDLRVLLDKYASDEVFLTAIRKLEYKPRGINKDIKYLLVSIEEDWVWFNSGKSISKREGMENKSRIFDFNTTTIEHIYSRNSAPQNIDACLEPIKNNIGNLTILDPDANSRLGNKPWTKKKAVLKSSNIGMNKKLSRKSTWNKAQFDQYENLLCNAASKVFSF